jgi:CrcB protein
LSSLKSANAIGPAKSYLLAFAGCALGTAARALVSGLLTNLIALFVVNLLGSFFLGYINGSSTASKPRFASAEKKWFWGAGFCGGFTTMSGLALAFVFLTGYEGVIPGLVYVLLQFAAGLYSYALGYRVGKGAWPSV